MLQCENCAKWTEDLLAIRWPICMEDQTIEWEARGVCEECLDHLGKMKIGSVDVPEIGSIAAQPGYVKKSE